VLISLNTRGKKNMKRISLLTLLGLMALLVFTSCDEDDDNDNNSTNSLNISFSGLEPLGDDYEYEGWIMVDGAPVSAGLFDIDANGNPTSTNFVIDAEQLENATAYILTIEPSPDNDPAPSDVHILAGDFSGNSANLTVEHEAAIGTNFEASTGVYILATPTDGGNDTDELSGVWWLDPSSGMPQAGLNLPTLPAGWVYEGWAVVDGNPLSTGRFTSVSGADDFNGFSGSEAAPPFPGEDLLVNAPSGLTFPTNLTGGTVVISVEPSPDNDPAPFTLKPLVSPVPTDAADHSPLNMNNNAVASNPTGTVNR
jgi:hypothetical protein